MAQNLSRYGMIAPGRESIQGGECETSNAIRCRRVCRCLLSDRFPRGEPGLPRFCENAGKSGSGDGGAELHSQPRGTTTGGQTVVADWRCHFQSALHAPSQIVAAIKSRADQLGASVVVSMVERSGVEACKAAVHNLLAQRVSGLIINYPLDDQDAIAVEAACANVPALFLDVSDQTPINSIIFSHEDGTRLGVEHLVALGHQQIALLAGPLSSVSARLRLAGWHKYLTRNQIQPIAEREGDWSAMSGFQQTMQMLNEGIVPTAMLVANDQMALGAMRAITESGLRVGADISVVGYDDTEDSSCYIPPLTTIKQDFRLLGQTSVDRLLQLSQGQAVKGNQLLPVSLVKRKTTLPPNTQTASPRALADSLMQLARQVSRLESGQ